MLDLRRKTLLHDMGITLWQLRKKPDVLLESSEQEPTPDEPQEQGSPAQKWRTLCDQVAACSACALHKSRTQTVFGVGNQQADLLVIGEAPGAEEDKQGEPFVGRAGQLLNQMLLATGYKRNEVYIANILKCRPPNNRNPSADEAAACEGWLKRQIMLIQPKAILCVGGVAATNLLNTDLPVGRLRGTEQDYDGIPVIVSYHPAYLLRKPSEKAKSWQDLKRLISILKQ